MSAVTARDRTSHFSKSRNSRPARALTARLSHVLKKETTEKIRHRQGPVRIHAHKAGFAANCARVTDHTPTWGPFNDGGRPLRLAIKGNLEFNQNAPAVAACVAGAGFGSFLSYQVSPFLQIKQLCCVLQEFEPPPRPLNIVVPHARLLPMRMRIFIDWIKLDLAKFQKRNRRLPLQRVSMRCKGWATHEKDLFASGGGRYF